MDAIRLVIPASAILVIAGAFFGVVMARMIWADEATHAAKLKESYENICSGYEDIHEKDQQTFKTMQETIDILKRLNAK